MAGLHVLQQHFLIGRLNGTLATPQVFHDALETGPLMNERQYWLPSPATRGDFREVT